MAAWMRPAGVMARDCGPWGSGQSFQAGGDQGSIGWNKPSGAHLGQGFRNRARDVAHFFEYRNILVQLVMAGRIELEIPDIAAEPCARAGIDQAVPIQPSAQRFGRPLYAADIAMNGNAVNPAGEMFGIRPAGE